jgi:hypothetical protein
LRPRRKDWRAVPALPPPVAMSEVYPQCCRSAPCARCSSLARRKASRTGCAPTKAKRVAGWAMPAG